MTQLGRYWKGCSRTEKAANALVVGCSIGSAVVAGVGARPGLLVGAGVLGCHVAVSHFTKNYETASHNPTDCGYCDFPFG